VLHHGSPGLMVHYDLQIFATFCNAVFCLSKDESWPPNVSKLFTVHHGSPPWFGVVGLASYLPALKRLPREDWQSFAGDLLEGVAQSKGSECLIRAEPKQEPHGVVTASPRHDHKTQPNFDGQRWFHSGMVAFEPPLVIKI